MHVRFWWISISKFMKCYKINVRSSKHVSVCQIIKIYLSLSDQNMSQFVRSSKYVSVCQIILVDISSGESTSHVPTYMDIVLQRDCYTWSLFFLCYRLYGQPVQLMSVNYYSAPDRISYKEAKNGVYKPFILGMPFGPT